MEYKRLKTARLNGGACEPELKQRVQDYIARYNANRPDGTHELNESELIRQAVEFFLSSNSRG